MGFIDRVNGKELPKFGDVLVAIEVKRAQRCGKNGDREALSGLHQAEAQHVQSQILECLGMGDGSLAYHAAGGKYQYEIAKQLAAEKGGRAPDYKDQAERVVSEANAIIRDMVPSLSRSVDGS